MTQLEWVKDEHGVGGWVPRSSSPGGSSSVLLTSTNITSANLLAGDVIEVLPAPGGRLYYVLHAILAHYRFGTTPYTGDFRPVIGYGATVPEIDIGGAFNLGFAYGPGSLSPPGAAVFLSQTEDAYAYYSTNTNAIYFAWQASIVEGKAISFASESGLGGSTPLADGDGSVTLRTWYSLLDGTPT